MKPKPYQLLLVVALVGILLLSWAVYAQEVKSSKVAWDYKSVTYLGDNDYQISQLGAQGWELVAVRSEEQFAGNVRQIQVHYYLKRPKQ